MFAIGVAEESETSVILNGGMNKTLETSLSSSLQAVYVNKEIGDRFEFGRYPQEANGEEKPITWRVLERDQSSLLVISESGLDSKPFNKEFVDITWADCTLRAWLNDEFINKAFCNRERSLIKTSKLVNNAGPSTEDLLFSLSEDEAGRLFSGDNDRICKSTAYAIKNGADTYNYNAWWWLRSRCDDGGRAAGVSTVGRISSGDVDYSSGCVRPALRLAL